MSVYWDMARDGGYSGEEAQHVAWLLEQRHREEIEEQMREQAAAEGLDTAPPGGDADDDLPF